MRRACPIRWIGCGYVTSTNRRLPRHHAVIADVFNPSLRGANGSRVSAPDDRLRDEAIHPAARRKHGLLREACHPVALRADRVARNDVSKWKEEPWPMLTASS